jgi:hypothetical protein
MTLRRYSSRSQQTTLTGAITAGATSMTVVSGSALLGTIDPASILTTATFTVVIDPDTAIEEIVNIVQSSTNTFTVVRAIDGSTAQAHSAGAVVRHMAIGRDYRDANLHTQASASYNDGSGNAQSMHGIAAGEGDVVGTDKTQTLTNKTLTAPTISNPTFTGTAQAGASIVFEGTIADDFETTLTVVEPTQDNTITLPNTTGTVTINSATQTLSNKTLGNALNAGGFKITNLATPTDAADAVRKDFADGIVSAASAQAVAASTSAASAAVSASSAAASMAAVAASAVAAQTSAASASVSQIAASTSAASAATSAIAANTSAVAASTSAIAASTSAVQASTSAASASVSAIAASTSAAQAAVSASSAGASVSAVQASAVAAQTSAASANVSAIAASTSAASALVSANSASASAVAANTSAVLAEAAFDSFDDRYLGAKSSDPTVDNDGNPLITGALYFNTALPGMKVYNGSSWDIVAPDTSNFVDKSLWSAKGAIVSASTAGTPTTLTVASTDGYVLSVSNATTTGLSWIEIPEPDLDSITISTLMGVLL